MFGRQTRLLLVKRLEHGLSAQIPRHAALRQSPVPWFSHPCCRAVHTTRSAKLHSAVGRLGNTAPREELGARAPDLNYTAGSITLKIHINNLNLHILWLHHWFLHLQLANVIL